ncbi:hypothetical protein [Dyadobacter beijingensis]|nr:hypothetical protein [Dyadobacter beijingensis]
MPTFAYNDSQPTTINLDNVDSIVKDDTDGYQIVFQRAAHEGLVVTGRWRFPTPKERDRAFKSIVMNYGLNHG